jgi:hypothetical protein
MNHLERFQFGIPALDECLGGGVLPGTLTVVAGATGIGKTQLGLHFARQGLRQEGRAGIVFDMSTRGDSQNHTGYAGRLFGWELSALDAARHVSPESMWQPGFQPADYLHLFDQSGRRVTRADLEFDDWRAWKLELARKLTTCIFFFYSNFVAGVRRAVIDGVEPAERPSESIQFDLFDYIYHQILRKDADWVARDLFREHYRVNAERVAAHPYRPGEVACLLLYTTREVMLEDLIGRPLDQGDVLSNANTVLYLGKLREGNRLGRALYVAKHRGSYCHDGLVPFEIGDEGLLVKETG